MNSMLYQTWSGMEPRIFWLPLLSNQHGGNYTRYSIWRVSSSQCWWCSRLVLSFVQRRQIHSPSFLAELWQDSVLVVYYPAGSQLLLILFLSIVGPCLQELLRCSVYSPIRGNNWWKIVGFVGSILSGEFTDKFIWQWINLSIDAITWDYHFVYKIRNIQETSTRLKNNWMR